MNNLISLTVLVFSFNILASDYNHPGNGNFFELGGVQNNSPYGYQVYSPYAVPHFKWKNLTLEAARMDYEIIKTKYFELGPMVNFDFTPFKGTEIDSIKGMKRSSYFDYGLLLDIPLPFGLISSQYSKTTHEKSGNIFKLSYNTGIPLHPLNGNHVWANISLEYTQYSKNVATYHFGVKPTETTEKRPQTSLNKLHSYSIITAIWTPLTKNFWVNLTFRHEIFNDHILSSPIVVRGYDQSILIGLMYHFD